jgi:hypothetical protein
VEAVDHPMRKDIADYNPTYKNYCEKWNFLVVRDGVLERDWVSVDGLTIEPKWFHSTVDPWKAI